LVDRVEDGIESSEAADELTPGADTESGQAVFIPLPVIDPTIGQGVALVGLYTFAATDDADGTPRSTIGAAGSYTNTESWAVGVGGKLYLAGDRYRVGLQTGGGSLNLKYYGSSADSVFFDNPVGFNIKGAFVDTEGQARVAPDFYLGIKFRYSKPDVRLDSRIDVLSGLTASFELSGLGLSAEYDTRDSTWYPAEGGRGRAEWLEYVVVFGSSSTFRTVDADYSHYWSVAPDVVLAANGRVAQAGDDAPFFALPFVSIRGFPAGRYLDQAVVQTQAEARWMFAERFGAVGFGGAGLAASGLASLGKGRTAWGYGVGLRYRVSTEDKISAGVDVSTGSSEDLAVYFRIGEAF
jgi:outer membrane protein assembly factor BamA